MNNYLKQLFQSYHICYLDIDKTILHINPNKGRFNHDAIVYPDDDKDHYRILNHYKFFNYEYCNNYIIIHNLLINSLLYKSNAFLIINSKHPILKYAIQDVIINKKDDQYE